MKLEYEKIHRSDRIKSEQYIGYMENTFGENKRTGSTAIALENNIGRLH